MFLGGQLDAYEVSPSEDWYYYPRLVGYLPAESPPGVKDKGCRTEEICNKTSDTNVLIPGVNKWERFLYVNITSWNATLSQLKHIKTAVQELILCRSASSIKWINLAKLDLSCEI